MPSSPLHLLFSDPDSNRAAATSSHSSFPSSQIPSWSYCPGLYSWVLLQEAGGRLDVPSGVPGGMFMFTHLPTNCTEQPHQRHLQQGCWMHQPPSSWEIQRWKAGRGAEEDDPSLPWVQLQIGTAGNGMGSESVPEKVICWFSPVAINWAASLFQI